MNKNLNMINTIYIKNLINNDLKELLLCIAKYTNKLFIKFIVKCLVCHKRKV